MGSPDKVAPSRKVCVSASVNLPFPGGPGKRAIKRLCGSMVLNLFIMANLRSRCGHYIFALWFLSIYLLSFFYSSPNHSGRTLDVYHTSTHCVALVQI